ncbi:MAG: sigma-70 family RNA polymerase sigma factor [Propionibacteriaceae bacterium]|nr:sigma-70 family RNA polymerase sigma factor [Propionibacteriaceae bacterium]
MGDYDPVVTRAGATARLLAQPRIVDAQIDSLVKEAKHTRLSGPELHRVLGLVTHVTQRNQLSDLEAALLSGVQAAVLASPVTELRSLDEAVTRWEVSGARELLRGGAASRGVAAFQDWFLRCATDLVQRSDMDVVQRARLIAATTESAQAWRQVANELRRHPAEQVEHDPRPGLAIDGLRRALDTSEPELALRSVLTLGCPGNVVMALCSPTPQHDRLIRAAATMQSVSMAIDASSVTVGAPPPVTRPVSEPVAISRKTSHISLPPKVGEPATTRQEAISIPQAEGFPDRSVVTQWARARDAGVAAQAALNGDPIAFEMLRHESRPTLRALADRGREAVSQMIASVRGTIFAEARRRGLGDFTEIAQAAALEVSKAAYVWDQSHVSGAQWNTYATHVARHAAIGFARAASRDRSRYRPLTTSLQAGADGSEATYDIADTVSPRPEDVALARLQAAENHRSVQEALGLLPPQVSAALVAYYGLDGRAPITQVQLAMELGVNPRSLMRQIKDGRDQLARLITGGPTAPELSPAAHIRLAPPQHRPDLPLIEAIRARVSGMPPQRSEPPCRIEGPSR